MIKELYLKYKEIINYVIVGGLTTVVSLGSFFLVTLVLDARNPVLLQVANVFSWICAVSFAYVTNRKYVFESSSRNVFKEFFKFISARLTTLLIEMICMAIFVSVMLLNENLSKFIVQFIVFILNYIFSKLIVFRKKNTDKET